MCARDYRDKNSISIVFFQHNQKHSAGQLKIRAYRNRNKQWFQAEKLQKNRTNSVQVSWCKALTAIPCCGLCDSWTHARSHSMHTIILKEPKFERVNECDKTKRWRGEGREQGGAEGESQKANVKNSLQGDKETSKERQNEKRYGKEIGLKH